MRETRANPAPLGLMGFGMTTVLLNIHNIGFFEMDQAILAMGIFYGGMAQVIAGIMEFRQGNTFGTTAFTSYGLFWLSLVWIIAARGAEAFGVGTDPGFMGWYLILWGLFTAYMFIASLKQNRALQLVFGSLTLLFVLLAVADWTGSTLIRQIAGWEGVVCGASAIYLAAALVLNEQYSRKLLPVGGIALSEMPPLEPTVEHPHEDRLGY